jgi:hypothetical protein
MKTLFGFSICNKKKHSLDFFENKNEINYRDSPKR